MKTSVPHHSAPLLATGWLLLLLCTMLYSTVAAADTSVERHALVIGNSDYAESPLMNPRNDASDMVSQLIVMGYKVYKNRALLNLDRQGIETAMEAFSRQLPDQANALFYFAGHGMATRDDNYMIPINHNLVHEGNLRDRAVSLRATVDLLKKNNPAGLNIVLLDACRDNPLPNKFRNIGRGLARLNDLPQGVFVGYAADSGQVAEDGRGRNGTYTEELLKVMRENPDLIIELAHKIIAEKVYKKTGGKQFPVSENKVYGEWCFGVCGNQIIVNQPTKEPADPVPAPETVAREESTPVTTRSNRGWWIAGGVAAAVIVGLLASSDSGSPDSQPYTIDIVPPGI